ncbi:hypothetical protein [Psychrobacter lutiphocae]|uniref:hypothetical protein n=1 Tax=Psychrobacter lutiphocae TaxID=540500 RepID=UPI0012E9A9C4|nr:hypothetical protein [Psychrobacter lutiphocae]
MTTHYSFVFVSNRYLSVANPAFRYYLLILAMHLLRFGVSLAHRVATPKPSNALCQSKQYIRYNQG